MKLISSFAKGGAMKKAVLILLVGCLFSSCAITGIQRCDKTNLGKYRCNTITCEVRQCVEQDGKYEFKKVSYECFQVNECQCVPGYACKTYKCVKCSPDGSSYKCDCSQSCENDLGSFMEE